MKKTFIIASVCLFLDQLIKYLLTNYIEVGDSITIIKHFFNVTFSLNTGAAFSLLTSQVNLLIVISIIVLIFLIHYILKSKDIRKIEYILYGFLIGGIVGNLIDRITRGAVIDYLSFNFFGYEFPIFNFADICIVVSMFLIFIDMIRNDRNEISGRRK